MMNTNHWLVIDTLVDCLQNGIDRKKLREATLQLDKELDRRLVDNFHRRDKTPKIGLGTPKLRK